MEILEYHFRNDKIHHAYLFCGAEGSERRQTAVQFAQSLLCSQHVYRGCGTCADCMKVASGNHPALAIIEPDGATVKIQQIKELQRRFSYKNTHGDFQIYIIDYADTMSLEAANSLLKFLEEPDEGTVAILLAERPEQLVATIVSRCQVIRFFGISSQKIETMLLERGVLAECAALASKMWSQVDEIVELVQSEKFATIQKIVVQLTEDIIAQKHQYIMQLDNEWFGKKPTLKDSEYLMDYLLYWFRELIMRELGIEERYLFSDTLMGPYRHRFSIDMTERWISDIIKTRQKLNYNVNPQLAIEALLLRMQEEFVCTG